VFWFAQPEARVAILGLRIGYFFSKTMFVALLALGAAKFAGIRVPRRAWRIVVPAVAVYSIAAAFYVQSIADIGLVQSSVMGVFFCGSVVLLLARRSGTGWLAVGFALRALLAIGEAIAYARPAGLGIFLASHSSFDTGAEWVIALGCVLTLYGRIQQELTHSNDELLAAKEVLQELVDLDSLTGLANRRALPAVFRQSAEIGATILFFDLNDFKRINDAHGHAAGDDCLKRFARALKATFRPDDHLIRYAGDEFVVVAPGTTPPELSGFIDALRERLKFDRSEGLPVLFSVGMAYLPVHGDAQAALHAADDAMYVNKKRRVELG
jgi:diguanylate cyclase (GGDEF)-like protein